MEISANLTSDNGELFLILPTLQETASYKVAIESWRRFISTEDPSRGSCWIPTSDNGFCFLDNNDRAKVKGALQELPLPRSIYKLVENCIEPIKEEMNKWLCFHHNIKFLDEPIQMGDLMFCYWLPDGKIDYRRTAQNMLSNPRMTLAHKFKIASRYCLEDEIKKFSVNSVCEALLMCVDTRDESSLIRYWLRYLKSNPLRFPITFGERLDSFMITSRDVNTWSAIEYFWDRLTANEQMDKVELILDRKPYFQRNLFAKMNKNQRFLLFSKMPLQIMENFWKITGEQKFSFWAWIYIQKFIDDNQFEEMMLMLCSVSSKYDIDEKIECLANIWNHCPDNFKKLAVQPNIINAIINFQTNYITNHRGNVDFLILYLSSLDTELKKKIIFEHLDKFVSISHLCATKRIIEVCLTSAEDVINFKKSVLESDSSRNRLSFAMLYKSYKNVNMFLDYFCEDPYTRSEFCDRVLTKSMESPWTFHHTDHWIRIIEFIDQNLLRILPDRAFEIQKHFVMNFSQFCCQLWSNDEKTGRMMEIVNRVLDTEGRKNFIRVALDNVQKRYYWNKFDEKSITQFLAWCFDNDKVRMTEFRKNLSIDDIFKDAWDRIKANDIVSLLQDDVDQQSIDKFLEPIQNCLLWYFENAEDVLAFKKAVSQNSSKDSPIFLQNGGFVMSDAFLKKALPWFSHI